MTPSSISSDRWLAARTKLLLVISFLATLLFSACGEQRSSDESSKGAASSPSRGVLFQQSPTEGQFPERSFAFSAVTELQQADAPPDAEPSVTTIEGRWRVTAAEGSDSGLWVHSQIDIAKLDTGRAEVPVIGRAGYDKRFHSELERPVLFHFDRAGRLTEVKAPATLISSALGVMKGLASSVQLVRAPKPDTTSWSDTELDATGQYAAYYSSPTPTTIVREHLGYAKIAQHGKLAAPTKQAPTVDQGETSFVLDDTGRIVSAKGLLQVRNPESEVFPALVSKVSFAVDAATASISNSAPPGLVELSGLRARPVYAPAHPLGSAFALDIAKVGEQRSLDEFLEALDGRVHEPGSEGALNVHRLKMGLGALLRLDEESELLAWSRVAARHPQMDELLVALSETQRPESHERLVALLEPSAAEGSLTPREKIQLMAAVSAGHAPSRVLVDAFTKLIDDPELGHAALLGLGSMIYQALEVSPHLADVALTTLERRLSLVAADPLEAEFLLRALGNSGHPRALVLAEPFVQSNAPRMRATAVRALRRVADSSVDERLNQMVAEDPEPQVRRAAQRVLREREQRRAGRIR